MQYVICYDIADDRRRDHLARALLDFGGRVEESVFVAHLDGDLAAKMKERIVRNVQPEFDRVHVFPMCAACAAKGEVFGTAEVPADQDFYVI